jgi:hypothetical protein
MQNKVLFRTPRQMYTQFPTALKSELNLLFLITFAGYQ